MSFFVTVAGKYVNEKRLDMIANNLANAQTAGFKASRPVFEVISSTQDESGQPGLLRMPYVNLSDTYIDYLTLP
jgi:flagellar basal body rod protein FlgG